MATSRLSIRQAAALAVRSRHVCLILSSSRKRWVIPKGRIERGQTAGETALQEAWEEAGLMGVLGRQPVGSYKYRKCGRIFHVTVFLLEVTDEAEKWPEESRRHRRWVRASETLEHINQDGLRRLLARILKRRRTRMAASQ
jgi:8-oxo-dGTP pyrophosphatase MutT (NUDIX family)